MNKTKIFILFVSIFSFLFVSCTPVSTDEREDEGAFENALREAARERRLKLPLSDKDFEKLPIELQEFELTYELLDLFYLYAHMKSELGGRNDYFEQSAGTPYAKLPFGDIYFMFSQMSCPFTNYYDPSYADEISDALYYSDYGVGFGFRLDTIEHNLNDEAVIANVYPAGPAKDAGLKDGDVIVSIDSKTVTREKVESLELSSKEGDIFTFVIARDQELDTIEIKASQVKAPTVYVNYRGDIPMITVTEFTDTTITDAGTYGEFKEALEKTAGAKATIINLADNGGGSVDHCESMAAEFLPKNTLLGYSISAEIDSSKYDYKQRIDTTAMYASDFYKTEGGMAQDRYVVFIENGGTASCAELMISAVTAVRNAPVVGTRSYGKGIGQYYFPTAAGGFAGVTSSQFMDQNKESYHTFGIEPDVVRIKLKDAVDAAFEIAEEGTLVRTAGYSSTPSGHFPALARSTAVRQNFNRRDHFGAFQVKKFPRYLK